jgi:23S rRNA (adenine2503-C2)-methyltransferase
MSTSLTTPALMSKLISAVGEHGLNMKLHYSLHSANSKMRKMLIPSHSTPTLDGLNELSKYKRVTGNDVEIHYTMIKGKNDWPSDLDLLTILLAGRDMSIKFLSFNTKEGLDYKPAKEKTRNKFMAHLNDRGIETEYYEAPGADVGASCGMFTV